MKVLHLNTFNTGGAARACLRIHHGLLKAGMESTVLLRNKTRTDVPHVHEIWEELNPIQKTKKLVEHKVDDLRQRDLNTRVSETFQLVSSFKSVWDVTSSKHYREADIIHLHWVANFVDFPSFFSRCDKKIVWTLHDFSPFNNGLHYPGKHSGIFDPEMDENRKIMQQAMTHCKPVIVSPSQYLLNHSRKSEAFAGLERHRIFNGTNTGIYRYQDKNTCRRELGLPEDKKIILFVAEHINDPRKGYQILIDALEQMDRDELYFVVVGKNQPSTTLREERVFFLGSVSDEEKLSRIYNSADLFVIPSTDENLPNTVSEAFCCGCPVAGFQIGGIPEMVTTGANGFLSPEVSAEGLNQVINQALESNWNNKAIASESNLIFDDLKCAKAYIEVYKQLNPEN